MSDVNWDNVGQFGNIGLGLLNLVRGVANDTLNWKWVQKNYSQQLAQFDWEKAKQMEAWSREDNAVQRRVADLRAAGINPLLAAGSAAGSSSPAPVNAPQMGRRDISQSMHAIDMLRQVQIDNANLRLMREEARNKEKEREEADARIAKAKAEEFAIKAREGRESDLHTYNIISSRLHSELASATQEGKIEAFRNEVRRSYLTNSSIDLDNRLRRHDIVGVAFSNNIKRVEANIATEFGFSQAEAEYAAKLLAVDMLETELKGEQHNLTIAEMLDVPTNVQRNIVTAVLESAGRQIGRGVYGLQQRFKNWVNKKDDDRGSRVHGNHWE